MVQSLRILIVQDQPHLAAAIAESINAEADLTVIGIAGSGNEAASVAAREKADVALIDFRLPDLSGPAARPWSRQRAGGSSSSDADGVCTSQPG